VRPVETPETLGGGRIVLTQRTRDEMTTHQMEVVSVGAPSICEDWDCERPHDEAGHAEGLRREHISSCRAGDWILVRHRGLQETDRDGMYICHQDDVLAVLRTVG